MAIFGVSNNQIKLQYMNIQQHIAALQCMPKAPAELVQDWIAV